MTLDKIELTEKTITDVDADVRLIEARVNVIEKFPPGFIPMCQACYKPMPLDGGVYKCVKCGTEIAV